MDDRAFDALTRHVSETWTSRRSVLGRVGFGALGIFGLGMLEEIEEADAKKKCKKKCKKKQGKAKKKCKKRCKRARSCTATGQCGGGQQCINELCATTCTTNAQCDAAQTCLNGACAEACSTTPDCDDGEVCVNGGCAGSCATSDTCTGGQQCIDGVCAFPPAAGVVCASTADCGGGGLVCVGNICVEGCDVTADCPVGLICQDVLGTNICVGAQCGPNLPCPGAPLASACLLGLCVEI